MRAVDAVLRGGCRCVRWMHKEWLGAVQEECWMRSTTCRSAAPAVMPELPSKDHGALECHALGLRYCPNRLAYALSREAKAQAHTSHSLSQPEAARLSHSRRHGRMLVAGMLGGLQRPPGTL